MKNYILKISYISTCLFHRLLLVWFSLSENVLLAGHDCPKCFWIHLYSEPVSKKYHACVLLSRLEMFLSVKLIINYSDWNLCYLFESTCSILTFSFCLYTAEKINLVYQTGFRRLFFFFSIVLLPWKSV